MQNSRDIKETLDRLLNENDTVFIVPHTRPDMDALGACIGMSLICKKNKKKNYIVVDDNIEDIEATTRKVIKDISQEFSIIKASAIPELITEKSLMIAVDVNKEYLISTKPYLDSFNGIFVLDHHKMDPHTIKTPYIFIDDRLSSTCEEISRLLFLYNVKISKDNANYLLAGIILDTNKMSKDTVSEFTYEVAAKLCKCGANPGVANNMFLEDYELDRKMHRLIDNTIFPTYAFAIACDKEGSGKTYKNEEIAKAADYALKFQVNATFAIAYISPDTVYVSARSKGIVDVSKVMHLLGGIGGGNEYSAATRIKGMSIEEVKSKLNDILIPTAQMEDKKISDESQMKLVQKA